MPIYEIEQYDIHTSTYRVEADSEADAVKKLFDGLATPMDDGFELIGICDELGLPVDRHAELADELRRLGVNIPGKIIPSIRAIGEVECDE